MDTADDRKRPPTSWYARVNGTFGLLWAFGVPALFWPLTDWSLWIKVPALVLWLVTAPVVVDRCIPRVTNPAIEWAYARFGEGSNKGGRGMAAAAFKEPGVPGIGQKVDKSFVVDLPRALKGPLLAITTESASILVPRALIEQTAARSGTSWKTEEERQQLIEADDAHELLGLFRAGGEGKGKDSVAVALLEHSRYLVASLLRSGSCMVVPAGTREPVSRIVVRYVGDHPSELVGRGMVLFMFADPPRTFLTIEWFIA